MVISGCTWACPGCLPYSGCGIGRAIGLVACNPGLRNLVGKRSGDYRRSYLRAGLAGFAVRHNGLV